MPDGAARSQPAQLSSRRRVATLRPSATAVHATWWSGRIRLKSSQVENGHRLIPAAAHTTSAARNAATNGRAWRGIAWASCALVRRLYALIGTWPGSAATRASHARRAGWSSSEKPPSPATCVYA